MDVILTERSVSANTEVTVLPRVFEIKYSTLRHTLVKLLNFKE